jgi:hypothetical protein
LVPDVQVVESAAHCNCRKHWGMGVWLFEAKGCADGGKSVDEGQKIIYFL